ncbi:MAG: DNA methyltransferase [Candidatus Staskawiczbacteria bacterium RIFCSPHIGHO2_01_FULL_36_16]|uniref:site-specific DNA-methyltransferase (adenine-specific) n=1 Tax=Candidatus Staskawiczbacteria bacterium RIFCSPHIGHO2_01_FULL_36_16 TaxID=1802200 RepID=A0A1G2HJC6_9BACT|nr:MAG: DNA methyltransferase [Candidatus Staskawiczbacteria bacterium RIFCSPHIGHO2_01_FULL_36_16]
MTNQQLSQQLNIYGKAALIAPRTEGIKYAGSKLKILPYIVEILNGLDGIRNVLDGFSGSTRVSQAFAKLGFDTTSSDISAWSEVFANCYLLSKKPNKFYQEIINHLNNLKGYNGWYTENYGADLTTIKRPFQMKNTRKLDAIRDEIEKLNLQYEDKCVILASLIYALDSVDSTLGHYVAYLSKWSPRSYKDMLLKLPNRFENRSENKVIRGDIFDTVAKNKFDFVYFDPPYGSNNEKMPPSRVRYASYYHIWTTIIKNDKPIVFGVANRREDSRDNVAVSVFEEFRKDESGNFIAMQALRKLIRETNSKYILLSYSSGGRATKQELNDIINESGKLMKLVEIDYKKNVMANMRWTNEWINSDGKHCEYLFLMEKK